MTTAAVNDAQIAEIAYALWTAEGCPDGRDQEFWFRAETQLTPPAPVKKPRAPRKAATKTTTAKATPAKAKKATTARKAAKK